MNIPKVHEKGVWPLFLMNLMNHGIHEQSVNF